MENEVKQQEVESLLPAGVERKERFTVNELQTLQAEADENDLLLPTQLNKSIRVIPVIEDENVLLPNGVRPCSNCED